MNTLVVIAAANSVAAKTAKVTIEMIKRLSNKHEKKERKLNQEDADRRTKSGMSVCVVIKSI
jgi:hypothetical protein